MSRRRRKDVAETKKIALERIKILLTKADAIYSDDPSLAQRYGERARKVAMKVKIQIPKKWRFRFCRKCKKFLYPGINAHVRIKSGTPSRVITYCELCQEGSRALVINK